MAEDAIHRATRWHAFYVEEDGLKDFFDTMRQAYFARSADLYPSDTDKLLKLGIASKIVSEIEQFVLHKINAGKIEQAAQDHADKIARLPEAKRRFL